MRKEVKIGIFGVLMLLCLYWGINFLKGRDLFNRSRVYYAYYDNASGVQVSSPVVIRGVKVGSVSGITFKPEMNKVELQLAVKSAYKIPDNSVAKLFTDGIMGGKALEIELGNSEKSLANGNVIKSESAGGGLMDIIGGDMSALKDKITGIVNEVELLLTQVNGVLGASGDNISKVLSDVAGLTGALNDDSGDLKSALRNLNTITEALASNSGKIDNSLANLETITGDLAAADLNATITKLNGILESLNGTEGSLGMLINDKTLYTELATASANLASLLEDLEQNPGRYVHFSLFGKKDKTK